MITHHPKCRSTALPMNPCGSASQTQILKSSLEPRFAECGLELHPTETTSSTARMRIGEETITTRNSRIVQLPLTQWRGVVEGRRRSVPGPSQPGRRCWREYRRSGSRSPEADDGGAAAFINCSRVPLSRRTVCERSLSSWMSSSVPVKGKRELKLMRKVMHDA